MLKCIIHTINQTNLKSIELKNKELYYLYLKMFNFKSTQTYQKLEQNLMSQGLRKTLPGEF